MAKSVIDTVMVFRILRKLTTPFKKWDANKAGLIDDNGKILVKPGDRTPEMKKAWTLLDRMVANIKKLLAKAPGGKSTVASYIAALALIKEHVEQEANSETAEFLFERLEENKILTKPKHDLSTIEGYLDAMEEAIDEGMTAGQAGALSPITTNAQANASGLAGPTGPAKKKKKKKIDKILNNL